jgi:hypothetical protein
LTREKIQLEQHNNALRLSRQTYETQLAAVKAENELLRRQLLLRTMMAPAPRAANPFGVVTPSMLPMEMQALRQFNLVNEANRGFAPLGPLEGDGASYASTPVNMDVAAPVVLQQQPTIRQPEQHQRSAHTGLRRDSFAEEKTGHPSSDSSLVATLRNRRDEAESNDG